MQGANLKLSRTFMQTERVNVLAGLLFIFVFNNVLFLY
jgi:hypothetical protein